MILPVYHEDLCQLFQRADCPSIFSRTSKLAKTLSQYKPSPKSLEDSITAIKTIIQAILYLRLNLIMPCQIKYEYVVLYNNKWGIRHAICQRTQEIGEKNEDAYNPQEYNFHLDSENELVWNIGKVWLRFFTEEQISVKDFTQKQIDEIINSFVQSIYINKLLKRLLCIDKLKRICFQQLLAEELLASNKQQQTKFNSSLICHLKVMSSLMQSRRQTNTLLQTNPFARQLRYRRFKQYLQIDILLQNIRSDIRKEYMTQEEDQKFNCQFTSFIIMLQSYKNMVKINAQRMEMVQRFQEIDDRIYYAKFTRRMIMLRELVDKKAKVLKNNFNPKKSLICFLEDPDKIHEDLVYNKFKNSLSQYVQYLKDDLKANKSDKMALKLLAKIYIARTSGYIFNKFRMQVFGPLFKNQSHFQIKKIHYKINQCSQVKIYTHIHIYSLDLVQELLQKSKYSNTINTFIPVLQIPLQLSLHFLFQLPISDKVSPSSLLSKGNVSAPQKFAHRHRFSVPPLLPSPFQTCLYQDTKLLT